MIMPQCDHCRRKHCMAHRVPESHGCRDAVKAAALLQTNADAQRLREDRKGAPSDAKAKFEAKKAELAAKRGKK